VRYFLNQARPIPVSDREVRCSMQIVGSDLGGWEKGEKKEGRKDLVQRARMVDAARLAARRTGDRGRFAIIILALPDLGMDWGVNDQGF
jgi:hypothetical protein